jgi:ryanodine receptor 3
MINMEDKSMVFTLNGELLITNKGSELCFVDFETDDGEFIFRRDLSFA